MRTVSLIGLKITLPFCLLLSFLRNRIPCKHNAWTADNLAPLDVPFLFIIVSLTSPKVTLALFVYYLLYVKMDLHFYLEKTDPAKTGAAGPFHNGDIGGSRKAVICQP